MPVLSGKRCAGQAAWRSAAGALGEMRPWLIKEIAGIRLAFVGLTTPALGTWLPPENLRGFEVLDPVETLRGFCAEVAAQKPDAIVLAGHMGLTRRDDFANRVGALTREFPQLAACLGGHTHQNHPGEMVNNVLYTQADHYGIHAGKVDLTFDRASRRLVHREAMTVPMDHQVAARPAGALSGAAGARCARDRVLAQPDRRIDRTLRRRRRLRAQASDVERLIASAMRAALREKGVEVDAVVHGLFEGQHRWRRAPKTVADAWTLLPYENQIVTLELAHDDLLAFARESRRARDCAASWGCAGQDAGGPVVQVPTPLRRRLALAGQGHATASR